LRPFAGTRSDAAEDPLLLACLVAPPLTTDGRWLATLRSAWEFGGGKASLKQLAYRGRASWQAIIESEIVDQLQLFRRQHHLETFVSRSVSRHVAPLRDRRKGGNRRRLAAFSFWLRRRLRGAVSTDPLAFWIEIPYPLF
jgi:hypothetical protein